MVDDVVIVYDSELPKNLLQIERIAELLPSKNEQIKLANVEMRNGRL